LNLLLKILLVLLFPLLLLARVLNALLGRDPLRLREPRGESCWIERGPEPDRASYFSEASVVEGRGHGGLGWIAGGLLKRLSRLQAPSRPAPGEKFSTAADREKGIPDEVYTLW